MQINIDQIGKVFDENMYLMTKVKSHFSSTIELENWYIDACRIRYRLPDLKDEELMPNNLKASLKRAGLKSTKEKLKSDFVNIEWN